MRFLKHLLTPHWWAVRAFSSDVLRQIESAITASERKHDGELRFAIEGPLPFPALRTTSVASGATPATPFPLIGAAIVPAVCVPCPARSCSAFLFEQSPRVTCSAGLDVGVFA